MQIIVTPYGHLALSCQLPPVNYGSATKYATWYWTDRSQNILIKIVQQIPKLNIFFLSQCRFISPSMFLCLYCTTSRTGNQKECLSIKYNYCSCIIRIIGLGQHSNLILPHGCFRQGPILQRVSWQYQNEYTHVTTQGGEGRVARNISFLIIHDI